MLKPKFIVAGHQVGTMSSCTGINSPDSSVGLLARQGQYTSAAYAALAEDCQVTLSVGRKGQCWDNAVAESFFASLKGGLIDRQAWPARAGACRAVVEYIAWYNGTGLRSTLGYRSPADFENDDHGTTRNVA